MASGIALIQQLKNEGNARILGMKPTEDKLSRLLAQSVRLENGQVRFPKKAPWLGEYLKELTSFPQSRYSDQVDSTSQALSWLHNTECMPGSGFLEYVRNEMAKLSEHRSQTYSRRIPF